MRVRLVVFAFLILTAWAFTASARSGGPPADTVKQNDGCTCHGSANPATQINNVKGWPSTYVPGQQYILEISSSNSLQPKPAVGEHQGGFLAYATKGEMGITPGSQHSTWITLGTMSTGEPWASHNGEGETANGAQVWNFTWTAPVKGSGSVTLHVYVNRINSDNSNSGDHWNKRTFTSTEGSGTTTPAFPTQTQTPTPTTSVSTPSVPPTSTTPKTTSTSRGPAPGTTPPSATEPAPGLIAVVAAMMVGVAWIRRRVS